MVTLVASVLALAACSGPPQSEGSPLPGDDMESWPLALVPASEAGFGAELRAQLLRDGPCLYLVRGQERWLPVWPWPGTQWDGSSVHVDNTALPIGSEAVYGGGETPLTARDVGNTDWVKQPAAECLIAKAWWIYAVEGD